MKRILIYGGCHALILRDMLLQILPDGSVQIELLINFHLIKSALPFPYEGLINFDVVIYSPIENKDEYNTSILRQHCRDLGVRCLCFPWLEWHGYCPGAVKGIFKGRFQWHYPQLLAIAADFERFDTFYDHVSARFPDNEVIDHGLEYTTALLRASECRHEMDIRTADYITDHFRASRLFLISDHPSRDVYLHVLAQLLDLLALEAIADLAKLPSGEPQWRWRTPILPKVAQALGLAFSDPLWVDDELVPGTGWDLRTYLSLYFYPRSVILGPIDHARIFVREPSLDESETMDGVTRLFAYPAADLSGDGLEDYTLLETLSGRRPAVGPHARFAIKPDQWRSTWAF